MTDPGEFVGHGELVNTLHTTWNKFNYPNNLSGFRHNVRLFYDENAPMTPHEQAFIRNLLADQGLRFCIMPRGTHFRWDTRNTPAERKIIYLDERWMNLFSIMQSESQTNALRLIFMATIIHCLGDYITVWSQPSVDMSLEVNTPRIEGGTKTEYGFFGGVMGGVSMNSFQYDHVKLRTFNSSGLPTFWIVPDHVARQAYTSDFITKISEVGLTRFAGSENANSITQLDHCCGWHRLVWRPVHRVLGQSQQVGPSYQQPPFGQYSMNPGMAQTPQNPYLYQGQLQNQYPGGVPHPYNQMTPQMGASAGPNFGPGMFHPGNPMGGVNPMSHMGGMPGNPPWGGGGPAAMPYGYPQNPAVGGNSLYHCLVNYRSTLCGRRRRRLAG